ncbi:L-idonate 5-dehydrogenase [Kribbella aluminosa]|uniref:L-idonate 5-dehydrogenase n=1 Tax=Kribbella aluminosa TaxID=416017 RepID=A0ABS4UL72_9ACTN|nr:alcohol dehydrogenase catalytic domain-containing protein [Kribbella aluminosa]MBP2352398.1 L-idonate 5-dehydrogenase [Kribbella aluminosa]
MYACVVHAAGNLRVEEQDAVEPGAGQVAVRIAYGGICGTDLHYYRDGGVGNFRVQEPLVLGHEVVGWVSAGDLPVGTPVGIHPATPCGECPECVQDRRNICAFSNYLGSAARMPHIQGGFVRELILPAGQVRVLPDGLELRRAVLAEPLSVAIHAVRRAGEGAVDGKRVLVTGAGPIGLLVVAALRKAGAREIIATDLHETPLALAAEVGATATVRADATDWPDEIDTAIEWLAGGLYVDPIVTHTFPLAEAVAAFELASDRTVASKVLLEVSVGTPR